MSVIFVIILLFMRNENPFALFLANSKWRTLPILLRVETTSKATCNSNLVNPLASPSAANPGGRDDRPQSSFFELSRGERVRMAYSLGASHRCSTNYKIVAESPCQPATALRRSMNSAKNRSLTTLLAGTVLGIAVSGTLLLVYLLAGSHELIKISSQDAPMNRGNGSRAVTLPVPSTTPRNLIVFIADGMGFAHLAAA